MVISETKIYIQNHRLAGDSCSVACKHSDLQSASDFEIIFQLLIVFWFLAVPTRYYSIHCLFLQLQQAPLFNSFPLSCMEIAVI